MQLGSEGSGVNPQNCVPLKIRVFGAQSCLTVAWQFDQVTFVWLVKEDGSLKVASQFVNRGLVAYKQVAYKKNKCIWTYFPLIIII